MGGDIDLLNDTISAMLVTADYEVDLDADVSESDVPESAVRSVATLTAKSIDGTTFRADDLVFASVTPLVAGEEINAVVLYLNVDTAEGSTLIAYLDNAPELPAVLDGENVTVAWDVGVNGVFRL